MSEIASVVERTRSAFAKVSQLEAEIARAPNDRALQLNLLAVQKMALRNQEQLYSYSRTAHIDICNYRLLPEASDNHGYSIQYISKSLLEYQNLFTQIYDALKTGKKQ